SAKRYLWRRGIVRFRAESLVAPVEVACAIDRPESVGLRVVDLGCGRVLRGLLAGPGQRLVGDEGGLPVHRLLEPGLLLGLEQRMVLERIVRLVVLDRHVAVERGVALLELQMVSDDLREVRRCLYRHSFLPWGLPYLAAVYPVFPGDSRSRLLKGPDPCASFDPVLPMPLRLVQCPVGLGEQLPLASAGAVLGHSEAAGNPENCPFTPVEGSLAQRRPDALGKLGAALGVGAREQNDELLPAPAAREVGLADGQPEDGGELAQDVVADGVPMAVVDRLEVVEVGDNERERRVETVGPRDLVREGVLTLAPVGDARQPVHERLALEGGLQARVLERDRRLGQAMRL